MNIEEIRTYRQKLRTFGRVETNVFSDDVLGNLDEAYCCEKSLLISCLDCGVRRLYFYTADFLTLKELFPFLKYEEYILEYLTKDPDCKKESFEQISFALLASMMRMSVRDCSNFMNDSTLLQYADDNLGRIPNVEQASALNELLNEVFDTRISHLQSDEDLRQSIKNDEVEIHQAQDGTIDAILQVIVKPQNFYINQIYNGAEKRIIHAMLQKRLKKYIAQGGKYAYAWVEKNNIASVKFHEKYGLKPDGLWNMVYLYKQGDACD